MPDYKSIKSRVLEVAKKEINKLSDINVDFEEIKENKKVVKIKFYISKKNNDELEKVNKRYENLIKNINNNLINKNNFIEMKG